MTDLNQAIAPLPAMPKRHPVLDQLAADSQELRTPFNLEVLGRRFDFQLLGPEGEDWVTLNTDANTILAFTLTRQKPRFAAALTAIAGTPIEDLWPLPEGLERTELLSSPTKARRWRRFRVLEFIIDNEAIDPNVLRQFDDEYDRLDRARREKFKKVDPDSFSKANPSGV